MSRIPASILLLSGSYLLLSACSPAVSAQADQPVPPPRLASQSETVPNTALTETDFVKTAATTDEYERQAGEIALRRTKKPQVHALAQQLVAAHTQTSQDLAAAAHEANLSSPTPALNPGQRRQLQELRDSDDADFDKLYLTQQAGAHQDALGLMKAYSAAGKNAVLVAAAKKTAQIVQQHLAEVMDLQRQG
jgi:putative membrane protein